MQEAHLRDLKLPENKRRNTDDLIKLEIDFIIKCIQGNPNGKFGKFGGIEERGLQTGREEKNGQKKPILAYKEIDNPARQRLGAIFAEKLEERTKNLNTTNNIDEEYSKMSAYSFEQASEDTGKFKDGRTATAIAATMKMGDLAKTPEQVDKVKKSMLTLLLSGILTIDLDGKGRQLIYGLCKKLNFPAGFLAKDIQYQKKLLQFLNEATKDLPQGNFEKATGYQLSDYLPQGKPDYKKLISQVEKWRNVDAHRKALEEFSHETLVAKNRNEQPYLEEFKKKLLDTDPEGLGGEREGKDIIPLCARLDSNINIIAKNTEYENEEFRGKDEDERSMKKSFWEKINQELDNVLKNPNPETLVSITRNFCNLFFNKGFGKSNREVFADRLVTAHQYREQVHNPAFENLVKKGEKSVDLGKVSEADLEKFLWRSTVGEVIARSKGNPPEEMAKGLEKFYQLFKNNLATMTSPDVLKKALEISNTDILGSKKITNRKEYNKVVKNIDWSLLEEDEFEEKVREKIQTEENNPNKKEKTAIFKRSLNTDLLELEKYCKNRNRGIKIPPKYQLSER